MKRINLQSMTAAQLAERFVAICVEDFDAIMDCDVARQNRCMTALQATERELINRPDTPTRSLLPYITHPNIVVRLQVARVVAPIATERAIATLEEIARSRFFPPAADAKGFMETIKRNQR